MPNIRHLIVIDASPGSVYQAVTTREGFAAWWTTEVDVKAGEEDKLRLYFGPDYFKELRQVEVLANRRVVWKITQAHPQWMKTELVFNIRPDGKSTQLFFEHNGWKDYTDLYSQCSYDWSIFLRSLKSYVETGKGKPYPDYL
jgi:uncharacterized protein YndB with AHSA1/START domain